MSAQDVELLRGLYEDWANGDYSRGDVFAPDIELSIDDDFPDVMIEPGLAGLRSAMRMWFSAWEKPFTIKAHEFVDLGEQVVVTVTWSAVNKVNGTLVERPGAHLWRIRDGKAVALKLCRDRAEAVVAASVATAD
jgi:ketosteroid isomerase-like protein